MSSANVSLAHQCIIIKERCSLVEISYLIELSASLHFLINGGTIAEALLALLRAHKSASTKGLL